MMGVSISFLFVCDLNNPWTSFRFSSCLFLIVRVLAIVRVGGGGDWLMSYRPPATTATTILTPPKNADTLHLGNTNTIDEGQDQNGQEEEEEGDDDDARGLNGDAHEDGGVGDVTSTTCNDGAGATISSASTTTTTTTNQRRVPRPLRRRRPPSTLATASVRNVYLSVSSHLKFCCFACCISGTEVGGRGVGGGGGGDSDVVVVVVLLAVFPTGKRPPEPLLTST